jgi:hypothetical protein
VILVPIVSIVAFLWFADREIVSGSVSSISNLSICYFLGS